VTEATGWFGYVGIDAREPKLLAGFYGALLGLPLRWESPDGTYVVLARPAEKAASLQFQRVADPTPGKNRMHVDIHVPDVERATAQAIALGAVVEEDVREYDLFWRVMRDPEGNLFCLVHHPG
jgi:predicted enzyme related to lactoylglutathione lyase